MTYDPLKHHRRSIRLKDYDYSLPGSYFITLCTDARTHLLGDIHDDTMHLNPYGEMAHRCWTDLPNHYPHLTLDTFSIMPNHLHDILVLLDDLFLPAPPPTRHPIPEIVRGFKSLSAKRINALRRTPNLPVWQRNYYEHIIRNDTELTAIRHYIDLNPSQWASDPDHPSLR